jgi:hypothetical protein
MESLFGGLQRLLVPVGPDKKAADKSNHKQIDGSKQAKHNPGKVRLPDVAGQRREFQVERKIFTGQGRTCQRKADK